MSLNLSNKNIEDDDNIFNEINNPEKYISIDLSHNLLTFLPKDLSSFSNLRTLNITSNKFKNYQDIAISLSTLPELQDLSIDLATQENVIIILTALPNLIKLNGQNTTDTTLQQSFLSQSNLTNIFSGNISNNLNNNNNSGLNLNLNTNNNNQNDNDKNEYKLNSMLFSNNSNENNNEKGDMNLNEETNVFEFIYKELDNESFNKKFQIKLRNEISNINQNLDIPNKLYNAIIVKSKLEIYSFILYEILNIILENNNYKNIKIQKIVNVVKDKMKENQNLLFQFIVKDLKKGKNIQKYESNKIINENKYDDKLIYLINENYENKNKNNNLYKTNKNNEYSANLNLNKENKNYELSSNLNYNKDKIIPISELISVLKEIYDHNTKQNEKFNKLNLPEINLSDTITPYLTTKYGIKSVASHWNSKIMEGINLYYNIDSEINLFKKILEGKIDESFYSDYLHMKSSCKNIIFQNLKKQYTYQSNLELDNLLDEKLNGFIKYEEWINIINNNLKYIDKDEAINEVMNYINKKNKIDEKYQKKNESNINRLNILFNDFTKVLLNIQINFREKYLNRLSTNFKICDKDNDGYINRKEFEELIKSFKNIYFINNKLIETLLEKIDPLRKNKISFNCCVEILEEKNLDNQCILELMQ